MGCVRGGIAWRRRRRAEGGEGGGGAKRGEEVKKLQPLGHAVVEAQDVSVKGLAGLGGV